MYKGNNNAGTLYGSIRTTWSDSGKGDTTSTFRTNAVGNEASLTGYTTSWSTKSMTFTGTFAKNTYYYLFLYSKSNSDMYYTTVANFKPTSHIVIDSTKAEPTKLKALEDILYGATEESTEARLPLPDEVASLMGEAAA